MLETKLFSFTKLTGKEVSESKLTHEVIQVAHSLGQWLKHLRVEKVFVEQLSFKQGNKGKGKNFNRLTQNQWKRKDFASSLSKHFTLIEINAAYTSTIGNVLNRELPDPIAASTSIAIRGHEVITKKSGKFFPDLPAMTYLKDHWKETEIPVVDTWKELHEFFKKNPKVKYRVSIPNREVFRVFQSPASSVGVL